MRRLTLGLFALALVAAPAIAGIYNKKVSVGDVAPAIAGLPATDGAKDMELNLSEMKEDVIVVAFLANHCPKVVGIEDRLVDTVKAYKGKSVKFIGVCCTGVPGMKSTDDLTAIKTKIKDGKYNLTYAYDESGKIGKAFGATVTPQFFVLDKARKIQYTGLLDDNLDDETKVNKSYVKTAVDALLAKESIETTETQARGCGIAYKR